ncbi:hypothetical protein BC937DRAFT_90713 [Endogone sp. FLAS-F59071]|nr:hypothetical protein BC937DRAFT_90713 [Endogone sp. FLAS-F59071]|eukprot:RUS21993.1 hypothetical protein BC937DRAFT_90713 [Endogone sp. FLAS-F59071]
MSQEPLDKHSVENMETTEIQSVSMTESNQGDGQNAEDGELEITSNTLALPTNLADEQHASSSNRVGDEHQGQFSSNTMDMHPGQVTRSYAQVVGSQVHHAGVINTGAYQTPANHKKKTNSMANLLEKLVTAFIEPSVNNDAFDKDAPYIETVFHLHIPVAVIPPHSANQTKVIALGNVKELGNWKDRKVQLFPINPESGHWASRCVCIKLTERNGSYVPIQYKYAIYVGKQRCEFEGSGHYDNRMLELSEYQFDMWKLKLRDYSYQETSRCSFVRDIIMDLCSSFDSKLIALDVLHTALPNLVQQTISNVKFIIQVALDVCDLKPKEIHHNAGEGSGKLEISHADFSTKWPDLICPFMLLCLYLGQYLKAVSGPPKNICTNSANDGGANISANVGFDFGSSLWRESSISLLSPIFLPIELPSSSLLSLLGHQTKGDGILHYAALKAKLSKDQWEFFVDGITRLVHHSIENEARPRDYVLGVESSQLEWMFAFRLTVVPSDWQLVGENFVDNYTIQKELLQRLLNIVEPCEHSRCSHSVFMDRLNACILPTLVCLAEMQTEFLYEYERLVKILISCAPIESLLYLYKICPIIHATFDGNHKNQETLYGWFIQRLQADIGFQDASSLQALLVIPEELQVSLGFSVIRDQVLKLLQYRNVKWSASLVEAIVQLVTDERIFPTSFPIAIDKDVSISGVITDVAPPPNHWVYINQAMERIHAADDFLLITAFPELLRHFLQAGIGMQHHAEGCFEHIVTLCDPWFQNLLQHNLPQKALATKSTLVSVTYIPNQTVAGNTHRDYEHATIDHQNLSSNQVSFTFLWLSRLLIILQPLLDSSHSLANQVQIQLLYMAQRHVMNMPERFLFSTTTEIGNLQPECIPKTYQRVMLSRISNSDFKKTLSSASNSQVFACHEWNDQLLARILQVCSSNQQNLKVQNWLAEQVVCYILDQSAPIYSKSIELSKLASNDECTRTFELLLRNARYWLLLLMATGSVTHILDHPRIQQTRECIVALRDMIFDGSITMQLLRGTVQKTPDNILLQLFECVTPLNSTDNPEEEFRVMVIQLLKKARIEPDQYLLTLQLLDQVISRFCIKAPLIQQFMQSKRRNPLANRPGSSMAFLTKAPDDSPAALNSLGFVGTNSLTIEAGDWTVADAEEQLIYLKRMGEKFSSQTLASLRSETRWGSLQYFVQIAQDIKVFMESATFMNVFLETVMQFLADNSIQPLDVNESQQDNKTDDKEDGAQYTYVQTNTSHVLTVANVAKLISTTLDNYCKLARLYVAPTPSEVKELTISEVLSVWHDISDDLVERELEVLRLAINLLNPSFKMDLKTDTSMIRRVVSIEDRVRKLSEILAALTMIENEFSHSETELLHPENILHRPSWVNTLIRLLSDTRKVEHLESVFDNLEGHFIKLSDTDWRLISELAVSGELFRFLKTILDMDFRSLINAVEDHSDQQLLREDTVSSLIEVRRLLSPFMTYFTKKNVKGRTPQEYGAIIDEFLDNIHQATEKSPQLATKLNNCNTNKIALQNMYANITNRGEVTKERIINAVTIGTFTFKRTEDGSACDTSMHYKSKQGDILVYNLNDLYDLRGRALMIAGSIDKTIMISDMDGDSSATPDLAPTRTNAFTSSSSSLREYMMAFVQKFDVANEINITASKLIDLGHFTYSKTLPHLVTSIKEMKLLLKKLANKLCKWEETVAIAHKQRFYLTFFRGRQILQLYDFFIAEKVSEENLQKGATLLKFVSSRAEHTSKISTLIADRYSSVVRRQNHKYDNKSTLDKLLAIGDHLDRIFADIPQHNVSKDLAGVLDHNDTNLSLFPCPGHLVVVACNDKARVPNIVMELYVTTVSQRPEPWQLYVCHLATTWEEINLFLLRCFHAHAHGYENSLFCMTNLEELNFDLQHKLVKRVRALISTFTNCQHFLALICYREHGGIHILDQFAEYVRNVGGLSEKFMKQVMTKICPTIVRVTSNITGEGKTEWIKDSSHRQGMIPRNLLLSGTIQRASLVRRFQAYQSLKSHECLHLDIGHVQNPSELNILLFEFLTLGMLTSEASIVIMPTKHIFIEIASTPDHELAHSIPICDSFTSTHLHWDIDRLLVSREPYSPIQVTCCFLDLLDRGLLDSMDFKLSPNTALQLQKSDRCRVLLDKYFFQGRAEISSFRFLDIFLRVLAEQLVRLSKSTYFSVLNLKLMSGENNHIRSTLVDALINVSKDFATRSVAPSTLQKSQLSQGSSATSNVESSASLPSDPANISSDIASSAISHNFCLTRWTDSNHLLVFFQSQNPEAISALYRDRALVPENIEKLLQSQFHRGQTGASDFALEDYDKLQPEQLLTKLEALARSSLHPKKYPEYALSPDNLLKMAIMLLRLRANLPVVLCGEAGCGKTSLIRFLSLVVEVPHFMVLNMHAGITEDQIIDFMNEAQKKAGDSSEVVWVFFDEINTCNHLLLVADIICHKIFLGRPVSKNLQLVVNNNSRVKTTEKLCF